MSNLVLKFGFDDVLARNIRDPSFKFQYSQEFSSLNILNKYDQTKQIDGGLYSLCHSRNGARFMFDVIFVD